MDRRGKMYGRKHSYDFHYFFRPEDITERDKFEGSHFLSFLNLDVNRLKSFNRRFACGGRDGKLINSN